MKKQYLTILSILAIVSLALTACGAAVPDQAPDVAPVSVIATGEPTSSGLACAPNCQYSDLVIGFLQTGSEGGWRSANTTSFKQTADELGLQLKFYDSQNDLARQVSGFQHFIQDPEVNVIILAAHTQQTRQHRRVALRADTHCRQRISFVCVVAGTHQK